MIKIFLGILIFSGGIAAAEPPEATLWVAREFIGGPKCAASGPVIHYTPPGFESEKAKLRKAAVKISREYFRDRPTCQACHTCPNYHREFFFEIRAADLPLSEKTGYRKSAAPDAEDLKEYEEAKKYKPRPDVPPDSP